MSEAYSISSLSQKEERATKEFAFTVVNKILQINWKGYYIQEITMKI